MIGRLILRGLVVVLAFGVAVGVALAVLLALGAMWVGDELRAAAPHDPLFRHGGATAFGVVLFTGFVAPALTALPALWRWLWGRCCACGLGFTTCWRAARRSPPSRFWPVCRQTAYLTCPRANT
ncbi:hypothetical protein [Methyloceanibacter marginalis]|uniref:hypothetical protein n=1 Tax=Methyloceanibacter marginalis TaxID=1774971 RepID=UPI00114C9C7D|nr:hypothetical protein [Methyloceanibacter marginalis]